MSWLAIAMTAQVLWAITVWIDKLLLEKYFSAYKVPTLLLYSSLFSLIVLPVLWVWLSVVGESVWVFSIPATFMLMLSGVMSIAWIYAYLSALEHDDASTVVPFFQFVPIFGMLAGVAFLGEMLSPVQYIGICIVTLGAMVLTYTHDGARHTFKWRLFFLMLAASALSALSDAAFKWGADEAQFLAGQLWMHVGILLTAPVILLWNRGMYARGFMRSLKKSGSAIISLNLTNEGLNAIGNAYIMFAVLLAPLAVVQTTDAYAPIITFVGGVLLARYLPDILEENVSRRVLLQKILGIAVVVAGSLLLY
jgi:transporter family protein